jgi:hypothetical protein
VLLSHVEEWVPAVPMDSVVERIDPTASNPHVQANAAAGFRMGTGPEGTSWEARDVRPPDREVPTCGIAASQPPRNDGCMRLRCSLHSLASTSTGRGRDGDDYVAFDYWS